MRANFDATRKSVGAVNWLQDPTWRCWPVDDATLPPSWQEVPGGGSVSRDTTASRIAVGAMGPRLTFGGATYQMFQDVLDAAAFGQFFDTRVVTAGIFVNADTIGIARLRVDDGVSQTDSVLNAAANPAVPEFLPVEHVVNAAATRLRFEARVEGAGNATFSAATFFFSDIRPSAWMPPITLPVSVPFSRPGPNAAVLVPTPFRVSRPFVVEHALVDVLTGPVGGAETFDVLQSDGAGAFVSMFATKPTLAAGITQSVGQPTDGVYNRRCFAPDMTAQANASLGARVIGEILTVAPTPGEDVVIKAFGHAWARPQEILITGIGGLN